MGQFGMGKIRKQRKEGKKETRAKNGFERLVEHREKAKEKAQTKLQNHLRLNPSTPSSSKRVIDRGNVKQLFLKKRNKKSIFDIESEDELLEENPFVRPVEDFGEEKEPFPRPEGVKKTRQERFQEIIGKSKRARHERAQLAEEQREEIADLNDDFDKIRKKLAMVDAKKIRETRHQDSSGYLKILDQIKGEQLLKPTTLLFKPKPPQPIAQEPEAASEEANQGDQFAFESDDDNVEIGDMEEPEINYRDRTFKRRK